MILKAGKNVGNNLFSSFLMITILLMINIKAVMLEDPSKTITSNLEDLPKELLKSIFTEYSNYSDQYHISQTSHYLYNNTKLTLLYTRIKTFYIKQLGEGAFRYENFNHIQNISQIIIENKLSSILDTLHDYYTWPLLKFTHNPWLLIKKSPLKITNLQMFQTINRDISKYSKAMNDLHEQAILPITQLVNQNHDLIEEDVLDIQFYLRKFKSKYIQKGEFDEWSHMIIDLVNYVNDNSPIVNHDDHNLSKDLQRKIDIRASIILEYYLAWKSLIFRWNSNNQEYLLNISLIAIVKYILGRIDENRIRYNKLKNQMLDSIISKLQIKLIQIYNDNNEIYPYFNNQDPYLENGINELNALFSVL